MNRPLGPAKPPLLDLFNTAGTVSARIIASLPRDTAAVSETTKLPIYNVILHLSRGVRRGVVAWTGERWEVTDASF
jgi:hypothetical protein